MENQMKKVARLLVSAIVLVSAVALGGCTEGVLDPKGPIAAAEHQILFNALGIMLAIVIPTILATLGVAAWFRAATPSVNFNSGQCVQMNMLAKVDFREAPPS